MEIRVRVNKKGIIVIPKAIREGVGIRESDIVVMRVEDNYWENGFMGKCCKGSVEEAEREEEEVFWERR